MLLEVGTDRSDPDGVQLRLGRAVMFGEIAAVVSEEAGAVHAVALCDAPVSCPSPAAMYRYRDRDVVDAVAARAERR
jgi:hypothetical protein